MPRRRPDRMRGDLRDFPRYSISEAAFYVRIPATTLVAWTRGQDYFTSQGVHRKFVPLIELADPRNKLLSFYNLVEAHMLRSTTERGVPLRNVRKALEYIRGEIPGKHPLLMQDFEVFGKDVFIQHLGDTVNATRHGQLAMRKILEKYLQRIVRDTSGLPLRIFPIKSRRLVIDPQFSSGKPIVKNRGIVASVLWGRNKTGETIPEIAKDYGLTKIEVKEAIEDYYWTVAA
jgi:uncharacterized protein (DUF433 family)